jgi:phosphoglycolate phosphatase-like HAD superfamily hydrolase
MRRAPGQAAPERCDARLVVLDFDSTLTDADAHAPAFHAASARELARRLDWDDTTARREWLRAHEAVVQLPVHAAWFADGHGVCPATCDPYVIANGVVQRLLCEHAPALGSAGIATTVLDVHRAAYASVDPPFRPEARAVLERLGARHGMLAVVTNSSTDAVTRLLDGLGFRGRERVRVRGGAGKFVVGASDPADPRFEALPHTLEWPELARPLLVRRGRYFDVLRALWDESSTAPAETLVAGDVFELDLALPAALGAHVHLVTRVSTMPHEVRLAEALARGAAGRRLETIVERLDG